MDKVFIKFGIINHSSPAFDFYRESTGLLPDPVPKGKNTLVTPFDCKDDDGTIRAAVLINQQGFEQTPEERAAGEEASGLSVIVAMDAPVELGRSALIEFVNKLLHPGRTGNA